MAARQRGNSTAVRGDPGAMNGLNGIVAGQGLSTSSVSDNGEHQPQDIRHQKERRYKKHQAFIFVQIQAPTLLGPKRRYDSKYTADRPMAKPISAISSPA
jgi:hypothetical protein